MRHLRLKAGAATSAFAVLAAIAVTAAPGTASGQAAGVTDPGLRAGPAAAGGPLPGLGDITVNSSDVPEIQFFNAAKGRFSEVDSVLAAGSPGHIVDAGPGQQDGGGLGPGFNGNSCQQCHGYPASGGASGTINPQITLATLDGARNSIPSFISSTGPIREARFVNVPGTNTPDGGVHDLFTIAGRSDAQGCNVTQPNFPQALAQNNVIFRIPISLFGDGLVESTADDALAADAASAPGASSNGVSSGVFNHSGNDGTITRFGWKAQNKSLMVFAGEAYNVEQGVTNDLFPNERVTANGCQFNPLPEDSTVISTATTTTPSGYAFSDLSSDVVNFAAFSRLLAAPTPAAVTNNTVQGMDEFVNIGCAACHVKMHTTGSSIYTNQSGITFEPFSDYALHDMGTGLQDRVSQGQANGTQFRSAPLWGAGQRVFFLHDGRTSNILTAIEAHASNGSEANAVIANFNKLSASNQQDILDFLRSL
jgi:CxxC motif-containing protein (DUF1111 family)